MLALAEHVGHVEHVGAVLVRGLEHDVPVDRDGGHGVEAVEDQGAAVPVDRPEGQGRLVDPVGEADPGQQPLVVVEVRVRDQPRGEQVGVDGAGDRGGDGPGGQDVVGDGPAVRPDGPPVVQQLRHASSLAAGCAASATLTPMANTVAPRVTLEMVAAAAGVSRGTASRVLSGSPKVSVSASTAVREAASRLGYRPNLSARSLVTGRSGLVGFAVNEDDDRLFTDPYFAQLVRGIHHELRGSDHALVLSLVADSSERSTLLEFAATRLDGLLLAYGHEDPSLADELDRAGASVVFAGRMPSRGPAEHATWVDSDSVGGAAAAVQHLVDGGRRCVGHVSGDLGMAAGHDRAEGWRSTLEQAGLPHGPDLVESGRFRTDEGRSATERLLARHPGLDAVFCANDLSAFGALDALAAAGRRVPDDVAVIGFDDIPAAATSRPPLTTVHQEIDLMGRRMARLLLDRLDGASEPVQEVLPTRLVVRESA